MKPRDVLYRSYFINGNGDIISWAGIAFIFYQRKKQKAPEKLNLASAGSTVRNPR
jgi:hypothetical protein